MIKSDDELCCLPSLELRAYAQGTAVLAFEIGQAFEVNDVGAEIIQRLMTPRTVSSLIWDLANHYGQEASAIQDETLAFLEDCLRLGLIENRNSPHVPEG